MRDVLVPRAIRLPQGLWDDLETYAAANGMRRSEAIRAAVQALVDDDRNGMPPPNYRRFALCAEYSQLALVALLQKLAPEMVERVNERHAERMDTHHGG